MSAIPTFQELVASVEGRAPSEAALERLTVAADSTARLSAMADRLLDHYVRVARDSGVSWAEIGAVLGVTKQAAQQRFPEPSSDTQSRAAYAALVTAEAEALALSHNYVGTEHILLALSRNDRSAAGRILRDHGVPPAEITRHTEAIIGSSQEAVEGPLPWSPRARRIAKLAGKHARKMGCRRIQTGHILLAILQQKDSVAAKILLERHRLDAATIRREVLRTVPDAEA